MARQVEIGGSAVGAVFWRRKEHVGKLSHNNEIVQFYVTVMGKRIVNYLPVNESALSNSQHEVLRCARRVWVE